jgi:hypothetical protein
MTPEATTGDDAQEDSTDTADDATDATSGEEDADTSQTPSVPDGFHWGADGALWDADGNPRCGSTDTSDGKACLHTVSEAGEPCHLHDEGGLPDNWGGNNVTGYGGGNDFEEGNTESVQHGATLDTDRRLDYIRDEGREDDFKAYFQLYVEKAENPVSASELAAVSVVRDMIEEDLIRKGLWEEIPVVDERGEQVTDPQTGEPVYRRKIRESDLNAYKSLLTEIRMTKKDEGITSGDTMVERHRDSSLLWDSDAEAVEMRETDDGDVDFQPVKDMGVERSRD